LRRRDRRARPPGPPRRGVRDRRGRDRFGPAGPARTDGQRGALPDVLPVRLDRAVAGVDADGRPRRGTDRHLPLAHRDRGIPVADRRGHRRLPGLALPAGVDPRPGNRGDPLVPHRGPEGDRGTGTNRGRQCRSRCRHDLHVRAEPDDRRLRVFGLTPPTRNPKSTVVNLRSSPVMAIEVRIPTILRSYTGGAKSVEGAGDTLADLLADLDTRHAGLRGRLVTDQGALHRFVNVYINDEDVRFLGALDAKLKDGDTVTVLPAVAGGAFAIAAAAALAGSR